MKAAVIQMNSNQDRRANLEQASELVHGAAVAGASLAVLPEHFAYMQAEGLAPAQPEDLDGPTVAFLGGLARELGLWIVGGSFAENSPVPGKVHNTCPVLSPDGSLAAVYRKIHLFDLNLPERPSLMESKYVEPGRELGLVRTPLGMIGLSICYDLRFAELYRRLRLAGAEILTAPSAFTRVTGQAHWELLIRTRAVENACFMLAAAQWGHHGGNRESFGQAMIIDPWGRILARCPAGPGVAIADISENAVQKARGDLDSTLHAKLLPPQWQTAEAAK